jgi:hypothetical protein
MAMAKSLAASKPALKASPTQPNDIGLAEPRLLEVYRLMSGGRGREALEQATTLLLRPCEV